jgi:hypothetical protein
MQEDTDAVFLWVRDIITRATPSFATVALLPLSLRKSKIKNLEQYDIVDEEPDPDYVVME